MKHCVSEGATSFPGFSPTRRRVGENPGNEVAEGACHVPDTSVS